MKVAAPLRFLALALGGWICIRAAMLAPDWRPAPPADSAAPRPEPSTLPSAHAEFAADHPSSPLPTQPTANRLAVKVSAAPLRGGGADRPGGHPSRSAPLPAPSIIRPAFSVAGSVLRTEVLPLGRPLVADTALLAPRVSGAGRWSGSAWVLLRDERGQAALAPGGTLGGSQAGARILYRIGGGLALSGRAYAPLRWFGGGEAAAGIDWRPSPRLPLHLLAERRQKLGNAGRSAFALTLYGGVSGRLPAGLRGEAYAQAGIVGLRSLDPFVDGSVRIGLPIGPAEAGGGAWGAAQPGAARLDAGPWIAYRLPVRRANLRLRADWRFRLAGDAAPGSGPALTLAADFR